MAINERLIHTAADAETGNAGEEGLILHLDANDVDSYDGDGDVWYDITNHEYTPAVDPAEHFNTILYTGDGTDNNTKSITGVGFEPDLVWIKNREAASNHYITDSVRGDEKHIYTESTSEENGNTISAYGGVLLDSDGFTVNRGSNSSSVGTNANNDTYVAWCFKAGGAAVSNTDGDITSQVSANNDLGFSIVSYTGNSGTSQTVGHGLDVPPELIFVKRRNQARDWRTYARPLGATKYLDLNGNTAAGTFGSWSNTEPTATVFTTSNGTDTATNNNNDTYIAYCFASKRGVSKVGSYTGSTGSVKVYTGFQPAFILIKNTSQSDPWAILDNKRPSGGGERSFLYPNTSDDEDVFQSAYTGVTFNGDGFTLDDDDSHLVNENGQKFIYLAFAAEKPDDLIDDTDLELHLDAADLTDSSTTWNDKVVSGNNGTLGNATYEEELNDSVHIPATSFSSGNTIEFSSNPVLNENVYSVEGWVKFGNYSPFATSRYITLSDYGAASGHHAIGRAPATGFSTGVYEDYINRVSYKATDSLGATFNGRWHHFVSVRNGTSLNQYLNGNLVGTHTVTSGAPSNDTMTLGALKLSSSSENAYLGGDIGQVRIYQSALTADEVMQNYRFTKNDYPNVYHATAVNSPTFSSSYFDFDDTNNTSTDYFTLSNDVLQVLSGKEGMSISAWVNFDTVSGNQNIVSNYIGTTDALIGFAAVGEKFLFYLRGSSNYQGSTSSANVFSTGVWTHIVAVYDGSQAHASGTGGRYQAYINGSEITMNTTYTSENITTVPSFPSNMSLRIAAGFGGGTLGEDSFDGKISKIKIYDRAITSDEVTAIFNEGSGN